MSNFPEERVKTYQPGDTIAAAELNEIQDGAIANRQAIDRGAHASITLYQPLDGLYRAETGVWTQNINGTIQTSSTSGTVWIPVMGLQVGDTIEELGAWVKDQDGANCIVNAYRWDGTTEQHQSLGNNVSLATGDIQRVTIPLDTTVEAQQRFHIRIFNDTTNPLIIHALHVKKQRL